MDDHPLSSSLWHQAQKFFLSRSQMEGQKCFYPQASTRNHGGFFEIEMLVWVSIILLIAGGFFTIHRAYFKEHQKIKKDYQNEWNRIESKRRNKKIP